MKKFIFCFLAITTLFLTWTTGNAQNPEILFQEGMMKAEGEGNLEEAIEIYYRLVNDALVQRNLRAKALMQVGICYEKLGKKNAQQTYEKLVSEYSDQKEIVLLARKKLDELKITTPKHLNSGVTTQQLHKGLNLLYSIYSVSPNGNSFLYLDQENNDDEIFKYDLISGKTIQITDGNTSQYGAVNISFPSYPIWSPDGKEIAYMRAVNTINHEITDILEVHIMDEDGENDKILFSGPTPDIPGILTFSPDGKSILGVLGQTEDNQSIRKLVRISLVNNTIENLKEINDSYKGKISYSPDGSHLLFTKTTDNNQNKDVFVMNTSTMKETQITFNLNDDWDPAWSPEGDQILFLSNRLGSNDLYKIGFNNGKVVGKAENLKTDIGDVVKLMGVDNSGALYFSSQNERYDIYTIKIDDQFNYIVGNPILINEPTNQLGGYSPRISKDGRYISYLNNIRFRPQTTLEDKFLGEKYLINIYDTKTKENRLLDPGLYLTLHTRELAWNIPSWSYDNTKLVVYATVKDNYQGGFYTVDVFNEEVNPVLTVPDCKFGTDFKRLGNSMIFARDNEKIYYSSWNWKDLMEFDMNTKKEKSIATNEDGFWFAGFLDDEETKCIQLNRFGYFFYDINTQDKVKFGDREAGGFLGVSNSGKYYYLLKDKMILRMSVDGSEAEKTVSIADTFENMKILEVNISQDGSVFVFSVLKTTGQEINRLTNIFD